MKILALAAAAATALVLAGCSSPGGGSTATSTASASASAVSTDERKPPMSSDTLIGQDWSTARGLLIDVGAQYSIWAGDEEIIDSPVGNEDWEVVRVDPSTPDVARYPGIKVFLESTTSGATPETSPSIAAAPTLDPEPTPTPTPEKPSGMTIKYVVTANGPILSTTFGNMIGGSMSTEQANDAASPVSKEYFFPYEDVSGGFNSFSVYAQAGEGTTTITCQILQNGKPIKKQTSTGPYAVVMCNGD